MGDRGYTIGILIGCILLLGAGIAFTWFEITEYRQEAPRRATPTATPAHPAPQREPSPDAEPDETPEAEEEEEEANGDETAGEEPE